MLNTFYVGDEPLLVVRLKVTRGGGLDGLAMRDLGARTRILAISRMSDQGYLEHPPRRGTRLRAGDKAYLIGPTRNCSPCSAGTARPPGSVRPVRRIAR